MRPDEGGIDAEALHRRAGRLAEPVVADLGDDGRPEPQPGGRDGDVGRAATEHLPERGDVPQRGVALLGVQVDADAADGDQVVRPGRPGHACTSAWRRATPAR
jgi:hypothetical protein